MKRALGLLGAGAGRRALDLACGKGRHALELVRAGWSVEAWDRSDVALEHLQLRAGQQGDLVVTRVVDLESDPPPTIPPFDLVVIVNYLNRPLLHEIHETLSPGASLVFVTFTDDFPGDHPRREFRLRRDELDPGITGLTTILREEHAGRSGILARRVNS